MIGELPRASPPRQSLRIGTLALAIATLLLVPGCQNRVTQIWRLLHLFDEDTIVYNFQHMDELFPTRHVRRAGRPHAFARGTYTLPTRFRYQEQTFETESFLASRVTAGMLVLDGDTLVYEQYWNGHSALGRHIAWSVSKSVVSALVGIAVDEGHIRSLDQPVTEYVPQLVGSAYDGVTIKSVLQMSSGVAFNEDYGDPDSDINRLGEIMGRGGDLLEFATTLERARPPDTLQYYVSVDTQVLGTLLVRATGQTLADYTTEKLWVPMGMESDAYWMLDGTGMEIALGGLNASLRDLARIGRLYLQKGRWNGQQLVPEAWVEASITPDAPHLMPGPKPGTDDTMGYGYQWWLPDDWNGEFMALGVYNQMIYADPKHDVVIALHSANRDFQRNDFEPTQEALALCRKIARELAARKP